ncbi:putative 3-dehydroquinate dehydratase, Shikimate dehydrogenase (NADP(+)) [Helianthus annuus]|nr:putative 3-dehydroquinate dehydratase, Shikimate dehydrogenase (NADP(+)) [Helianthus annuus]
MGSLGVLRKTTMVCVPLMSHSVEQLVGDMFQAKNEGADLVEIRLDFLKEFDPVKDLRTIVGCRPLPIVVVYRYVVIINAFRTSSMLTPHTPSYVYHCFS